MYLSYCIRTMKVFAVDNEKNMLQLLMIYLKALTKHRLYIYVTALVNMNRITISLISLVVISMVLPTSANMYASGQSTTSDNSGSSTSDSGSESTTTTSDNSGSSTGGGTTTDDNAVGARSSSDSGSTTTTTT